MRHTPGFISPSRNLSCLATMCPLLPIIGRVSGGYWQLTKWASEAHSRVSCPVRVGWFLVNVQDADLVRTDFPVSTLNCTLIGHVELKPPTAEGHSCTLGAWTPDQGFSNPQSLNPLYPSTWGVWTPDQGFLSNPSNQLYPMAPSQAVYPSCSKSSWQ
jgi:hypothetical protein